MNIAAVILAGGASRRMGSPKALLPIGDETFADRLIRVFSASCQRVVVVLGHDAEHIRAGIRGSATFVVNADHALGQLTSLQCGLRACGDADAALFTPVDYPAFQPLTVQSILAAWTGDEAAIVPMHWGRRGHPVLIARPLMQEILALPPEAMAREVIHRHVAATKYVQTTDPGILRDIDNPADFEALRQVVA